MANSYSLSKYFIYGSGDKRGHGKTPLFMAGMKCLPLCKVPLLSAANNCVQPIYPTTRAKRHITINKLEVKK